MIIPNRDKERKYLLRKVNKEEKSKQGKRNRASGARFELKVRGDLEKKEWIVSRWCNNVEFMCQYKKKCCGRLIPAKRKYNPFKKVLGIGTGFPDFIAYHLIRTSELKGFALIGDNTKKEYPLRVFDIYGIEVKSGKYLTQEEKEKCRWLLSNNVFSKILIAHKSKQRGKIEYLDFKEYDK